jgi:hypothetical protein
LLLHSGGHAMPPMLLANAEGFPWLGLDEPSGHGSCPSYQEEE